jgi:hypothetical protein
MTFTERASVSNTYKLPPGFPKDLSGKIPTVRMARFNLKLKFGLWKNYSEWVNDDQQTIFWYDNSELEKVPVTLELFQQDECIFKRVLTKFEILNIDFEIPDMQPNTKIDLSIKISGIGALPVRNNVENSFVCGMVKIESLALHNIDISNSLNETYFGTDTDRVIFSFLTPSFHWLLHKFINDDEYLLNTHQATIDIEALRHYNKRFFNTP